MIKVNPNSIGLNSKGEVIIEDKDSAKLVDDTVSTTFASATTNKSTCSGTNTVCTNQDDCSGSSNTGNCNNISTCFVSTGPGPV